MRTSGLYVPGHFGEVLQPAVRSDGGYGGCGLQVPAFGVQGQDGIRRARVIIEKRTTRPREIKTQVERISALNLLAGRIARRTPRSEKAATAPREIPDQLLRGREIGVHIYFRIAGNAS